MARKTSRTRLRHSTVKHPERYAFVCFALLVGYTLLVVMLYRSRTYVEVMIQEAVKPVDPITLLASSHDLNDEIPDEDHSVLREPAISSVQSNSIVVFVQSRRSDVANRYLIRQTWGNSGEYRDLLGNVTVFVMFTIGIRSAEDHYDQEDIEIEMIRNRDILLLNMTDDYDKLTVKGLLTMTWIKRRLPFVKYVIKTDDDIFLNMFGWASLATMAENMQLTCVLFGYVWISPKVFRSGKYSVTKSQFQFDHYPSFCSGAAYMIPMDSMSTILDATAHIPLFLRDDPYFTGIVAQSVGIRLISLPVSTLKLSEAEVEKADPTRKPFLTLHGIGVRMWYRTWARLLERRKADNTEYMAHLRTIQPPEAGLKMTPLKVQNITLENECRADPIPPYFDVSF